MKTKEPNESLFSRVSRTTKLDDKRFRNRGLSFGTVEDVARQLGIKIIERPNCLEFSAPKQRLQMFMEKLHFSMKRYTDQEIT